MKGLEDILSHVEHIPGVKGALVASTSGGYIAGKPPATAHLETFTTMSAILLGAAQTATKELDDRLRHVEVKLNVSRLLVFPAGDSALLVLEVDDSADLEKDIHEGSVAGRKIANLL